MEQVRDNILDYLKENSFMEREAVLGDNDSLTQIGRAHV